MTGTRGHPDVPGLDGIHRTAIRVGGFSAGLAAAAFVVVAAITQDEWLLLSSVGPAILTGICYLMLRYRWQRAELILVLAALSTTLSYKFFGAEESATPAAIGVVVIVSIGVLFASRRWQWTYVTLGTIGLFLTGPFWQGLTDHAVWIGVSAALSGFVAMMLFASMRNGAVALDRRFRLLVERMPVPLIEHDWSEIREWIEECKAAGVTDMAAHLDANPHLLGEVMSRVRLRGFNPALQAWAHHPGDAAPPNHPFGLRREELAPFVRSEVIDMFNAVPPRSSEHKLVLADGTTVWTRFHAAELVEDSIEDIDRVIAAIDVSELRETQAALAEQVRSKDEFVAAVSHELRTPLTSVLGFADLLATSKENLTDDQRELVHHLLVQAEDMSHIVEDLLVAARAEIGTVAIDAQPLDVAELVRAVAANSEGEVEVSIDAVPVALGDRVRVGQILRNLLTNSSRYGGTHRSVTVRLHGDAAVIDVADDGIGIPPEDQERIFEPYTRAHDRPGMTASVGLGLAVSRQLAELMGGALTYRRLDDLSVFRLSLPLATSEVAASGAG